MSNEVLQQALELNKYFTSLNGVDVPDRVSIPRDEWRAFFEALAAPQPAPVQQEPINRTGCTAGKDEECTNRHCATKCPALAAPKSWKADVQKVRDSLEPEDWCGDERMRDVLDRVLNASCCTEHAAGTSCLADPRPNCPLLAAAPQPAQPTNQLDDINVADLNLPPQPAQPEQELVQIEHWRQDTIESGRWEKTRKMPKHVAKRLLHHFDQASIINVAPAAHGTGDKP